MSGFEVLHSIRRFSDVPVMVLTVSEEEARVVKGLEMGANAYVIKPFRQMEFLARLKSAIGTLRNPEGNETQYKVGPFRFYPSLCRVESDNRTVSLTPAESTILLQLVRGGGKPVTLSSIAQKLWRQEYPGSRETIRVHVNNLRQKLEINPAEPKIIVTAPGIGYSLSAG
jgi:two-component system KDP operon response regulator KdpE